MMKNYSVYLFLLAVWCCMGVANSQTVSQTYTSGDIPTAYDAYDSSCNGSSTALTVQLPSTGSAVWEVTSVDVEYDMTAQNGGWTSDQMSQIYFQNDGVLEASTATGTGFGSGTISYNRNIDVANGYYLAGTDLIFEMRAWRTFGNAAPNDGCNAFYNKVDDGTWVITVNYQQAPDCSDVQNVQVGSETSTTVEVSWTDVNPIPPSSWTIEYGAPGFTQGTGTTVTATTNPATINNLTADTDYELYIQADCGITGTSGWVGPISFKTAVDCSFANLGVTNPIDADIVCKGSATLEVTPSGNGDEVYWYDAPSGGNLVGIGSTFTTPELTSTTSYWASEVLQGGSGGGNTPELIHYKFDNGGTITNHALNPVGSNPATLIGLNVGGAGLSGTALQGSAGSSASNYVDTGWNTKIDGDFTIAFWTSGVPDSNTALSYIFGDGSASSFRCFTNGVAGTDNWLVRAGGLVDLEMTGGADSNPHMMHIVYNSSDGLYTAYVDGVQTDQQTIPSTPNVTGTGFKVGGYSSSTGLDGLMDEFRWYDRALTAAEVTATQGAVGGGILCESSRIEVKANVSTTGDVAISTLPYNTSDDTANYGDPFSGAPGTSCGTTENYLNGNNVVYQYTATDTEVVDILMSNLNDFYAAVFVYGSCADVGVSCLAGAVAGPSDDDFGIRDFQMTAGEEYYIVVSSWLIPTYDYTLDIIPFSCSNLAAPDADSPQDFVAGDEIGDLVVDTNRPGATLNYYSDAAATTVVATTDPLMDGTTYYVTQSYEGCESAPVAITVSEIDCTTLAITNSTGDSVSCKGEMTLTATASGTGSDIYWYDAATDGNLVGVGNTFDTPVLTNTTSYWVTEVFYQNYNLSQANGLNDWTYGFGSSSNNYGIEFTADKKFVLSSVEVFSTSDAGGNLTVELLNDSGTVINTADFTMPSGGSDSSPVPVTLNLNFEIPSAGTYRLAAADNPDLKYEYDFGNSYVNYPYQLGNVGELTASFSTFTTYDYYYYYFYNWNVIEGEYTCESTPRTEVVATVNQSGDVSVDYTDLDYNANDSTSLYGNSFQGDPGSDCSGVGYLDGNEVIYEYTADPANDDILQIELSNITNPNTGMFIYSSCGDIGTSCIEGGTNEDTPFNINISDYYMTAGETIYIVISSENGATNYTLDIFGFDCANAPLVDVVSSYDFVTGGVLSDISVSTNVHATEYTWYSDAALTNEITDPTTETLVDGTTYYVTQTILGCETDAVAVTAVEFDCTQLSVSGSEDQVICAPGGQVDLNATSSGSGSEIYWFNSQTSPNPIGIGEDFSPSVSTTTSFWVAEVFLSESSGDSGPLPTTYCVPSANCSFGDDIDGFTLQDSSGSSLFSHTGTGCSTGNYADYTGDSSLTATLISGQSYDFTVSHNFGGQYVKIWIDFNKDGTFDESSELLFQSPGGANPTNGSFTIPQSALGNVTVMRVRGDWLGAPASACSAESYGEVHDYKVTVVGATVLCESNREEVVVTVNDQPTAPPSTTAVNQDFCSGATLGDIQVTGSDITWYESETIATPLALNQEIEDGATYYVSQTVDACESETRLAITVSVKETADMPTGATNQSFGQGDSIFDLVVQGYNLRWYTSTDGLIFNEVNDPSQVILKDQETYYVTQTPPGMCESEKLPITVHRVLDVNNPLFNGLEYYPNPVEVNLNIANNKPIDGVVIFNLQGQKVLESKPNNSKTKIDMSRLASGTYFAKITVEDNSTIVKIIKE